MIRTLRKLLEYRLLSKSESLENLDNLLPYLVHPNTQIREETINFISVLANPSSKILTKAEVYCLIRPKLKKYLLPHEKVFDIYGGDLNQSKLKHPLS